MVIIDKLAQDRSKFFVEKLAIEISENLSYYDELIEVMLTNNSVLADRAAWVFSHVIERNLPLAQDDLPALINYLKHSSSRTPVIRNIVRYLQQIEIPQELEGVCYDNCFQLFMNNQTPVAIKVFTMTVLAKIAIRYPDLIKEVTESINYQLPRASSGFKSRAKKTFKMLERSTGFEEVDVVKRPRSIDSFM